MYFAVLGAIPWQANMILKNDCKKATKFMKELCSETEWQGSGGNEHNAQDLGMGGKMESARQFSDFCQLIPKPKCQGCAIDETFVPSSSSFSFYTSSSGHCGDQGLCMCMEGYGKEIM